MRTVTIIVVLLMLLMAWITHRNARFCLLDQHEHAYSACFLIAAIALIYYMLP